MIYKLRQNSK